MKGRKTGGRQAGTPNKITKALKDMILSALETAGGEEYLAKQAIETPSSFMTLLGRVLPTTVQDSNSSQPDLAELIREARLRAASCDTPERTDSERTGTGSR